MTTILDRLPGPVLIVGGYGYRNLGDEAILAGLLSRIGGAATVVSRDPESTTRLHGVPAVGIGGAALALRTHASLLIGGGGLFGRDMGRIGRLLPAFGLAANFIGRTVVIEGIDLDQRLAPSARLLVPRLMRRAARVTVRDRRSSALLESWGIRGNLAPDASSWMRAAPPEHGRRALLAAGVDPARPVVGLALSAVRRAAGDAALDAVSGAMDSLPDVQFCFLPMSRHPFVPTHDDLRMAQRLRVARPRLLILEDDLDPSTMLAAFGQLSAVVAMRYHAMLFAERSGVPLVPLVYAEKNVRWLLEHHIPSVAPTSEALTTALWMALARDERAALRIAPVGELAAAT